MLGTISSGMLIRQALVIVFFCVLGYVFIWATGSELKKGMRAILSFPVGLSFFCVGVYSMLVVKIRISPPRLVFVLFFAFISVCLLSSFLRGRLHFGRKPDLEDFDIRFFSVFVLIAAAVALFCCSGILSVSLDNDSYYYYSTYPQILIKEGDLKYEFDVLLTDSGIMTVVINTIPYLFGFLNTFGIQHFLNIDFLLLFCAALFFEISDTGLSREPGVLENIRKNRKEAVLSLAVTVFLATSPAYITTAKWIMAGDYFMVFFFLLMYLGYRETQEGQEIPFVLMMFTVMTAMMRQEGPIMAAFLIVCLSMLDYSNKKLATIYMLPLIIAAGYYYLRVFIFLRVYPLYAFLTKQKALLIMGGLILLLVYISFIRRRWFSRLEERMTILIPAALIVLNVLMLVKNHGRYLENLYAFFMNIRLRNGWGYFGYFFFVFLVLSLAAAMIKKDMRLSFFDVIMVGYILLAVCAAWGRGDYLRIGTGDSGNRVMLTAVPLITFSISIRLFRQFTAGKPSDDRIGSP